MANNESLADQAVDTIAAIRKMTEGVDNEHPERHAIREMKRVAESIIGGALTQARALADTAERLQEDMRKQEALRAKAQTKGGESQ